MSEAIGSASVRTLYTTAPKSYDYCNHAGPEHRDREGETFDLKDPFGMTQRWRVISIQETGATSDRLNFLVECQEGRYASGLYPVRRKDPRGSCHHDLKALHVE